MQIYWKYRRMYKHIEKYWHILKDMQIYEKRKWIENMISACDPKQLKGAAYRIWKIINIRYKPYKTYIRERERKNIHKTPYVTSEVRRPLEIGVKEYPAVDSDDHMTVCQMPICPCGPDPMIIYPSAHMVRTVWLFKGTYLSVFDDSPWL